MEYSWIDTECIHSFGNSQLLLFGAGKGAEETIHLTREERPDLHIIGIVDNNTSLHGEKLLGVEVYDPRKIEYLQWDLIVITSVSGRESIAQQLEELGYIRNHDFLCIGMYPSSFKRSVQDILLYQNQNELIDKRCLHIGPGGFLGVELVLYSLGARKVYSVDKFGFGFQGYDITSRLPEYLDVRNFLGEELRDNNTSRMLDRFDSAIRKRNSCSIIDEKKIAYSIPIDVESLPFEDGFFDCVYSFALLEHVVNCEKAVRELSRVTKPGGVNLHTIITEDHRSFSAFEEFHPFSFRFYSNDEWRQIVNKAFYQNRLIPSQWYDLFSKFDFKILNYSVRETVDVDLFGYDQFHSSFRKFSKKELSDVGCTLYLEKIETFNEVDQC